MYAAWIAGTAIQGARWDNSDSQWENTSGQLVPTNAADAIDTGLNSQNGSRYNMSAVVDSNFDVHLIFIDANTDVLYRMFDESVPSWGSASTIATGSFRYPTISRDSTTGNLYAIYMDESDNSVDYATYTGSWGSPTANWNTTTNGNFVTSNYQAPDRIFAHWSESVSGDYGNVDWAYIIVPEYILPLTIIPMAFFLKKWKLHRF